MSSWRSAKTKFAYKLLHIDGAPVYQNRLQTCRHQLQKCFRFGSYLKQWEVASGGVIRAVAVDTPVALGSHVVEALQESEFRQIVQDVAGAQQKVEAVA